jgi:hypothetical protein
LNIGLPVRVRRENEEAIRMEEALLRLPDENYTANGSSNSITTDIEITVYTKAQGKGPLTKVVSLSLCRRQAPKR